MPELGDHVPILLTQLSYWNHVSFDAPKEYDTICFFRELRRHRWFGLSGTLGEKASHKKARDLKNETTMTTPEFIEKFRLAVPFECQRRKAKKYSKGWRPLKYPRKKSHHLRPAEDPRCTVLHFWGKTWQRPQHISRVVDSSHTHGNVPPAHLVVSSSRTLQQCSTFSYLNSI